MERDEYEEGTLLYHYTDFKAMQGIIVKGEIWLWNLRRMNDSQEMQYFIKELKNAVKERLEPELYPKTEALFAEHLRNFEQLSSYAACFSEYADDAAQWARYAKNGLGVCIAFNKALLSRIGEAGHAPLCKVSYSKNCGNLDIAERLIHLIRQKNPPTEKMRELFNNVIASSPLFKHPSFISEKEYRLVSLPYNIEDFLGEPHFFVEETNIKKYYILNMKSVCQRLGIEYSSLFAEVCIGPQARVTKDLLYDYFYAMGVPELCKKITLSECPLRRF